VNGLLTIFILTLLTKPPPVRRSPYWDFSSVLRPRVICLAATLAASATLLASLPARGQAVLFPGELRPSVTGQDPAALSHTPDPTAGPTPSQFGITTTVPLPFPESGAGVSGFVSAGNRKVRVKLKPGQAPPPPTPDRATLIATPAQLGTAALRPKTRFNRRGYVLEPARAVELQRPIPLPPDFIIVPPITPLRQARLEAAPFAPIGIHAGTYYLYPAIELTGGWDSNPQHATIAKSAPEYLLAPELLALSDWDRHALNFNVKGFYLGYGSTFFPDSPVWLNRPSLDARAIGRIDVYDRSHFDVEGRLIISTDNPGSPNIQAGLETLPIVVNGGATLGYTQALDRVELTAKGMFDRFTWQKSFLTDGTYVTNGDRNYDQIGGSLRGSYEVLPGVKPYVEAYSDERVHDITVDSTGAMRDSDGQIYKVGTTFVFSPMLTGEIAVGRTQRSYRDPTLANVNGPLVDGSVLFLPNPLTTIKFNALTTTGELVVVGASGVLHRDYTLEVDHDFRRWLTGIMKLGYGVDYYVDDNRTDHRYFISTSLTYKFTRDIWLRGEFRHDWLSSNVYNADYQANLFLLSLRMQR
jgi:hypothetical protein